MALIGELTCIFNALVVLPAMIFLFERVFKDETK